MTVTEFYASIDGDYEMALATFKSDEKIYRYLLMYLEDESYGRLCAAKETGNISEAFEAAHALKGVTGMFYLTGLFNAIVKLVEQLRPQDAPIDEYLFQKIKEEQQFIEAQIRKISI